ncbi:glycosyltransferase family 4 protein [Rugamonas sp. CCM 8940]|uniref:glycosyltransferase family 4 protein n=1 Tax=Rugamonas sp. CCM 8940 TaxID=2765359 RepID=UPI0018F6319E|nr:glycosyltransferase family 1 protein [Rugamonas sp. CCM 8940]MBJ7313311.1 glycosyltransferase family 4 protein [Rugamonas sp. CCM 8940]
MAGPEQGAGAERQLLVDLSVLHRHDDQSGIQRLVRNTLRALLAAPPAGLRVCPVYDAGGHYAYTACHGGSAAEGAPISVRAGDIFLGLDLCPDQVPLNRAVFADLRRHGVGLYFVVYDLLPLTLPAMFAPGAAPWFSRWLDTVAALADGLLCISRAVADELLAWLEQAAVVRPAALRVGYFHLGADLAAELPAGAAPAAAEQAVLARLAQRPAFLMVGTLEPRKMHAQALDAFELLWRQGGDASLVVVGKPGWLTEHLQQRLLDHAELGQRLFWLPAASDAALLQLYQQCAALLAASAGEGFGLPLIEAAQHGLPILARDIPVFREVCGGHAVYFDGAGVELAAALHQWLARRAAGTLPDARALPWQTWRASSENLLRIVMEQDWYKLAPTLLP